MVKGKGYYKRKAASLFVKGENNPNYKKTPQVDQAYRHGIRKPKPKKPKKSSRKCPTMFRPTKRYTEEELKKLVKPEKWNPFSIPGADGQEGNARILRPQKIPPNAPKPKKSKHHTFNIEEGNIIVEKSRMLELFNSIQRAHKDAGTCDDMDIDIVDFKPWGHFVSAVGACRNCEYRSERTRLYEEVTPDDRKPGRRAAKGNMGMQFTLQDTPIHNTEAQLLVAALGVRPGSLNGMQKLGYTAAGITEQVGKNDIERQRQYIKQLLEARGLDPRFVATAFDVMYHGMYKASHVTPGTGAQQTVGTCIEQLSGDGLIVGVDFANKLCLKGSAEKGKGKTIICGPNANHPGICTATQGREELIQEKHVAKRVAKDMFKTSGLINTHVCTDSDGKGLIGFEEANEKIKQQLQSKAGSKNTSKKWKNKSTKNPPGVAVGEGNIEDGSDIPPLRWHKDPIHLGWNMGTHIKGHTFSRQFFGRKSNGKLWNHDERMECRKWLAKDVPIRVSLTIDNLRDHCKKDYEMMRNYADTVCEYMIKCYGGDHTKCKRAPLAQLTGCRGPSSDECWFTTSINLVAPGITQLNLSASEEDKEFLQKCIEEKLSYDNIDFVAAGYTTSQCEGANRCYTKGLPNNRNYYRTAEARVYSSVCRKNNTLLKSTQMKFEAGGCRMREGIGPIEAFENYSRRREQVLAAKTRPEAKARKKQLDDLRRLQHAKERLKATNRSDYRKNQLDEAIVVHKEAVENNQFVRRTAKMVRNAKKRLNKRTVRAVVNKIQAQKKRKETLAANRAKVEKARVIHKDATPRGLHEHDYGIIPGVPVPGTSR